MKIFGPCLAKYPKLINQFPKMVTNHDEETPISNKKINGMSHQHVIDFDLDGGNMEKDVLAPKREKDVPDASFPIVISDSDEEDAREQKSHIPFHEIALPRPVQSPALKMIVSFALL